jgi:PAS domain S-box-containing protein
MRTLYGVEIAVGGRLTDCQSVAEDREIAAASLVRALGGESVTASALTGEGAARRSYEVVHKPQMDDEGRVIGVLVRARDVTASRHTEEQLGESRALLRSVIEGTTDAVYVKDSAGRYLLFNSGAEAFTGRSASEMLGKDDSFLFSPEDAAAVMDGDRRVMASGRPSTYEERITAPNGEVATFLSTKGPVFDQSGQLLGIFGIARDITERTKAEDRMRTDEAELEAVLDATADGILAVDQSRRVILTNRRFAEMWCIPDELVQAGDDALLLRHVAGQLWKPGEFLAKVEDLMRSDATVSDTLMLKDGRVFARHSAPIIGGSELTGRVWSFSDMTASEHAKAELQERERTLSALLGNLPGMAYRCVNDRSWTMEVVSAGCVDVTGYPPEALLGNAVVAYGDLVHPDDSGMVWEGIQGAIARGEPWTITYRITTAAGELRWVWERGTALGGDDEVTFLEGFIQDITAMRLAEEELRDREARLQARTEELDVLLSVSRALASSIDYDEVLAHAARAAANALGCPRCDIWEYVPGDEVLVCRHLWEREATPGLAAATVGTVYEVAQHAGGIDSLHHRELVLDQRSHPELSEPDRRLMDFWGEQTWLTVPLVSKRGLLGVMTLSETECERWFTERERRLVVAIAEQAGVALENALLVREQEAHSRWLGALVAASREAASRLEMDELLADIARYAAESVGAPLAYVYELDPNRDVLVTRSRFGSSGDDRDEPLGSEFPVADVPFDRVILAGDEVVVQTVSDPRLPAEVRGLMENSGEKTLVNVPLRFGGEPFGMLVLIETAAERRYTFDELDYLRALGEQAAVAVHNARLYEEAREARRDLAALNLGLERRVEQRTRDLSAANAELEAFAYSVSHDLRAPLRAIDGFSLVLLEEEGEALSQTGHEYLARVRASAQRKVMARLIEQDPARRVTCRVEPGCAALSDVSLLEAVLTNLLGNAWKFTQGLAEAHVEFGCRAGDDETVYFVRDDGAGFDPAYSDKLFQPFQRLHTEQEFAGTGIGLATVRRIIGRLGGRCWAEGAPGAGATFFFTLPA